MQPGGRAGVGAIEADETGLGGPKTIREGIGNHEGRKEYSVDPTAESRR